MVDLNYKDIRQEGDNLAFWRQRGAAIWMFPGNATRALLMAEMQEQGIKVLVEVDDNYLVLPPPVPGFIRTNWKLAIDPKSDVHTAEAHGRIVKWVDGLIVSTPKLADEYFRVNPEIFVCPNCVDPRDWPLPKKKDGPLRIGYAGSFSHLHDVKEIQRALEWAGQQPDVEIVFIGLKPTSFYGDYETVPWTDDVAQYRRNLSTLDVGLCPLRPGKWADCKSDVKALEYAMAGALPVVSMTEPYRPWWDRTFTADREKDWLRILKELVGGPDQARALASEARAYVLAERTIEKNINLWREAVV